MPSVHLTAKSVALALWSSRCHEPIHLELARFAEPAVWASVDAAAFERIRATIAPLMRFMPDIDLPAISFELRAEQLAVALLKGDRSTVAELTMRLREDLSRLPLPQAD